MKDFKTDSIRINSANKYSQEELDKKIVIGKLTETSRPEFVDSLKKLNKRVQTKEGSL